MFCRSVCGGRQDLIHGRLLDLKHCDRGRTGEFAGEGDQLIGFRIRRGDQKQGDSAVIGGGFGLGGECGMFRPS